MKKYEELHELIHGLDSHELRYFKLFAQRHVIGESNKYIKLFDAIKKQNESDDDGLRKVFKGDKFSKNLPAAKQYLLKLVHKALYHYHDNDEVLSQLRRHMAMAEIFAKKSQPKLALASLTKAKKIAEENELFLHLMMILEKELFISVDFGFGNVLSEYVKDDFKQVKSAYDKALNLLTYRHPIARHQNVLINKGHSTPEIQFKNFSKELKKPHMKNVDQALSAKAKLLYYQNLNLYNQSKGYTKEIRASYLKMIALFNENTRLVDQNSSIYRATLFNYLLSSINLNDYKDYDKFLKQYAEIGLNAKNVRLQIHERYNALEAYRFLKTKQFHLIDKLAKEFEIQTKILGSSNTMHPTGVIYEQFTACYMYLEKFKDALKWNNMALNEKNFMGNNEFYAATLLHDLVIHFELKNEEIVKSKLKSLSAIITDKNKMYPFVDLFKLAFPIILHPKGNSKSKMVYPEIKKILSKINKDKVLQAYNEPFNFVEWFESKGFE